MFVEILSGPFNCNIKFVVDKWKKEIMDGRLPEDFLYRNFKNNEHYSKMYPTSNQPAQLYGTAKTHKHKNIDEMNVQSLNFRPIIVQTGTCTYNAAQVISNYLKSLYTCNEYIIGNTHDFSNLIQEQSPLLNSLLKYRYLQNIKIPRSLVQIRNENAFAQTILAKHCRQSNEIKKIRMFNGM